jgi:hypothetical protein
MADFLMSRQVLLPTVTFTASIFVTDKWTLEKEMK